MSKTLQFFLAVMGILYLGAFAVIAMAEENQCRQTTIFTPDGRVVSCVTCCYGGNCTTTCF